MGFWGIFPLIIVLMFSSYAVIARYYSQNNQIDNQQNIEILAAQDYVVLDKACINYGNANKSSITTTAITVPALSLVNYAPIGININNSINSINFNCILQQSASVNYSFSSAQITFNAASYAFDFSGSSSTTIGYALGTDISADLEQLFYNGNVISTPLSISNLVSTTSVYDYQPYSSNYKTGFVLDFNVL